MEIMDEKYFTVYMISMPMIVFILFNAMSKPRRIQLQQVHQLGETQYSTL